MVVERSREELLRENEALRERIRTLETAHQNTSALARDLERTKRTYQKLVENISDVLFTLDVHGRITYISPVVGSVLELSPQEMTERPFTQFVHPEDRPLLGRALERSWGGKMSVTELRLLGEGGRLRHARVSQRLLVDQALPVGVIGLITDITKQKQAELELREQENRFRAIVDAFDGLIFITDRDQRISYMNNRLIERTGREALGEPWFQVVHGLDSAPDECSGERVFAGETLHQEVFSPLDGRWYYSVEAPIEHADGSVSRQVLMMDINDLKLTEEALLREKERLDVTLGSIGDGVISTDVEGNITLFNREAERLLGCNPINALGQPLSEVYGSVDPTTRQPLDNPVLLAIESGQVIHPPGPALVLAAGDQERLVEETAAPIFDHEGRLIGAVLAFRDITEKQVLQTELIRGQRMESLSIVAAGLAHEFNNHLGVILGSLSLARRQAFDPLLARALEEAEKASVRAKGLTEQLLVYSRAGKPSSRRGAVLGHLLTHAAEMAVQGTSSVVRFQIPDDLWSANVDEEQIRHVVNNLVIHAVQSMPGGGVVTVSAANLLVEATQQTALPPGRYIQVTVHDDGLAIPMDQLARLFEPAQLGKPGIRSLGLFIAGAVIKRHDGHLMAFSQEGEGTTLQFYLPANTPSEHSLTTSLPNATLDRGRVLLLEDEQQLQTVARLMLETLGYKVVVVANGAAAVDEFRQALHAGRPFDLVITDLTIPAGMGGKEAVRQMMELDPGVRAIVSSGYPDDPAMQNYRKFGFSGAVAKPYQLQDLERVIQRVQDEAEA